MGPDPLLLFAFTVTVYGWPVVRDVMVFVLVPNATVNGEPAAALPSETLFAVTVYPVGFGAPVGTVAAVQPVTSDVAAGVAVTVPTPDGRPRARHAGPSRNRLTANPDRASG